MGEPTKFPESNFTWKGWPEKDGEPEVLDLPAFREGDVTISCWRMTWRERLRVLFTGSVWLRVIGRQPPVYVGGEYPFERR